MTQVLFGENKDKKLHHYSLEWAPFSDEIIITIVLALLDTLPEKDYIKVEIGRLETIGEALIEHLF